MKALNGSVCFLILSLTLIEARTSFADDRVRLVDELAADSFMAIQKALPELRARNLKLLDYRIYVHRINNRYVVSFLDAEVAQGERGVATKMELSVELSEDGERVERSFYNK
jgi:hypothetical protein